LAGKIYVVGVGPGHQDYLTPAATKAVASCMALAGGRRALALFETDTKDTMVIGADMAELIAFVEMYLEAGNVGLLSSGDPGFYGLLAWVKREFPEAELHVVPGISSIQLASARFAAPWQDAVLLSLHGRASEGWEAKVLAAPMAILLTGGASGPQLIATNLLAAGSVDCLATYGLALSLENESLEKKLLSQWAADDASAVAGGVFLIFTKTPTSSETGKLKGE